MRPYTTKRAPASQALIELRRLLGMSQAEFAIKVTDVAPMTISRWETKTPPRFGALLDLADVAHKYGHTEIRDQFGRLYLDEYKAAVKRWNGAAKSKFGGNLQ